MKFDVNFFCEYGSLKLEKCGKLPDIKLLEEMQKGCLTIGQGMIKQIVIDILNK